jgi:hypothetical protein
MMTAKFKQLLRPGYRAAEGLIRAAQTVTPETRFGDTLISFAKFLLQHRRFPTAFPLFNDVLYGIKVTNEILDPLRVFVTDKEFAKIYIKATVGDHYNIPTLAVIRNSDDVLNFPIPDKCVIKPTHASGKLIIRRDGEPVDTEEMKSWFDLNYYRLTREANYKSLKPKIIIEKLVEHAQEVEFRVFCVEGVPKIIKTNTDREGGIKANFFDLNWNEFDFSIHFPKCSSQIRRPQNLSEMLTVASKLSEGFGFIRIDLYSDGKEVLVGEITNCDNGAGSGFKPKSAENLISKIIFG